MKFKKIKTLFLAITLSIGLFHGNVYAYADEDTQQETEAAVKESEASITQTTEEPMEAEPVEVPEEKAANMFPMIALFITLLAGGGGFLFLQMKRKKQAEQVKPDPDADYTEEDDDFELPDNEEGVDDEEIDAEFDDEENELM